MKRIFGLLLPALVAGFLLPAVAQAQNCTGSPNANTVCAGPTSGGSGLPSFRGLSPPDMLNEWFPSTFFGNNGTTAYNAVHAQGGGVILVPGGASDPFSTMPASFTDAAMLYLGPSDAIGSTSTAGSISTFLAKTMLRGQHASPHTTSQLATFGIEAIVPSGSGQNGPGADDAGLVVFAGKPNWNLASGNGFGEVDAIDVFVRNGGPTPAGGNQADTCGICINTAHAGLVGFDAAQENVTTQFSQGASPTIQFQIDTQIGGMNSLSGAQHYIGYVANATAGTGMDFAYLAGQNGGTWACAYGILNNCIVNMSGHVSGGQVSVPVQSGTSCPGFSLAAGSSDVAGRVTFTSATSCTIQFGTAFTIPPFCVISPAASVSTSAVGITTTTLNMQFGTAQTVANYSCMGV